MHMFEPAMKNLVKETRLSCRSARNLVRMRLNIRVKIYMMTKFSLKAMSVHSRYITITKRCRDSHPNIKPLCVSIVVVKVFNLESNQKVFFQTLLLIFL